MLTRLQDYLQTAYRLFCMGILLWLWCAVLIQFFGVMIPRLDHLGINGIAIDDRPCGSPQCDFSGFWAAGLLARSHQFSELFDPRAFLQFLYHVFSPEAEMIRWYYPPTTLLPIAAISYLPFETAFWVWSFCLVAAAAWLLRRARLPYLVIIVVLLSPAALWNFELGQLGTVMGACLIYGLFRLAQKRWTGGVALGLLIFKPQYAILAPIAMLASRNWRCMLACALLAGLILMLTTSLFGLQVWRIYLTEGLRVSRYMLQIPPNGHNSEKFGVSVFWMVRSFGGNLYVSYLLQAISSLLSILGTWLTWRSRSFNAEMRVAVTVMLTLMVTPYGYTDDMVAWSAVLALSAYRRQWQLGILDILFWIWPMLCPIVSERTGLLLTPVVVLLSLLQMI
ncbi:MAG: DUF2029 domain-containing protein, partial [Rhodospirillales bacterium]|nr:DUF2029 domain-containing protein [Rhodospirillales bacterium]